MSFNRNSLKQISTELTILKFDQVPKYLFLFNVLNFLTEISPQLYNKYISLAHNITLTAAVF